MCHCLPADNMWQFKLLIKTGGNGTEELLSELTYTGIPFHIYLLNFNSNLIYESLTEIVWLRSHFNGAWEKKKKLFDLARNPCN